MTSLLRRRVALASAALLALAGATSAVPAGAAAVKTPYTCTAPDYNDQKFKIDFAVDITPLKVYVGTTKSPKAVVKATIPGNIVGLAAFFGIKSASATGKFSLNTGGTMKASSFTFPRTNIPQQAQSYTAVINVPLPAVSSKVVRTLTYKPGPIAVTLTGYNKTKENAEPGDNVGSLDAGCTSDTPNQVLRTLAFVKSPTAVAAALTYSKATKRATETVKVNATSGVVPTGSVTATLFRGTSKVAAKTVALSGGKATVAFAGVKAKGSYKVVTRYNGSAAHNPSTATRSITVR